MFNLNIPDITAWESRFVPVFPGCGKHPAGAILPPCIRMP